MKLTMYQIDAFADRRFEGNPAAVCLLPHWLDDEIMQAIAQENNLSETAFVVESERGYEIRWFTPAREVDLCGHATLASAHVVVNSLNRGVKDVVFQSRSGPLKVGRDGDLLEMDFPAQPPQPCALPAAVRNAFDEAPSHCLRGDDFIVVFDSESAIASARPDLQEIQKLPLRGLAITAKSEAYDFVMRFFAPRFGIDEDPVTGSAFTQLIPYWSGVLGKRSMVARQVSSRGGDVRCEMQGDRVKMAGRAATYFEGKIRI